MHHALITKATNQSKGGKVVSRTQARNQPLKPLTQRCRPFQRMNPHSKLVKKGTGDLFGNVLCKTSAGPVDFEERGLSCKHSNRIRVRQCNNEEPKNSTAPGRASIASEPHEFIILRLQCSCGGPSLEFRSRLTELIQGNSTSEQATNRQRATNPWYNKERDSL